MREERLLEYTTRIKFLVFHCPNKTANESSFASLLHEHAQNNQNNKHKITIIERSF